MSKSIEGILRDEAVGALRDMTAGLLSGRAAQTKRGYPSWLTFYADRIPEHAAVLREAAITLSQAEALLLVAEGNMSRVLRDLDAARLGGTDSPVPGDVVH